MKISKILCCVSVDPLADIVADFGFDLSNKLGAEIALVSIIDEKLFLGGDSGIDIGTLRFSFRKEVDQMFIRLLSKHGNPNIAKFCVEGDPKKQITEIALSWEANLIVIASHARTGVVRLIMGSVAESVLRQASCPVLVIPAHKA